MQIVIDIPEDVYTRLFDNGIQDNEIAVDDVCEMARALRLGTLLPKGHGDLVDRNDLKYEKYNSYAYAIANAPTIIEADKSESQLN